MPSAAQPQHSNRLIESTSPYLLQHAHNPVEWHEWGPEALEKARRENKPIFLSIGYSACHWCHVMERESFEDDEVAAVLNRHFVSIKVDREQRPDLDEIYMAATVAFTGSGGWPMSVWLTPDLEPFYAGTYFPPQDRHGLPGFRKLLEYLVYVWNEKPGDVQQQAAAVSDAVRQATGLRAGDAAPALDLVMKSTEHLADAFDPIEGGIAGGRTNKFPPSMAMDLMLRAYHHSLSKEGGGAPKARLLELVELTLDKMARGGIYDQLAGGIHRYSTDPHWLVPHFEKMLYDQAMVADIYLKAFQLTGKTHYGRVAGEILQYVIDDLQSPEGGYWSARDADSEGVEGKFYVWSRREVLNVLGSPGGEAFCDYFDISENGNWEEQNILNAPRSIETVARLHKLSPEALQQIIDLGRRRLLEVRAGRVAPLRDDKVLAAWNGLMIAAMARGGVILGNADFLRSAERAASFVVERMTVNGRLQRSWRADRAQIGGYLDDHAFLIEGLLNLYEATFDLKWLDHAARLNDQVLQHFLDEADGGFFYTADDAEKLLVRSKESGGGGPIPSGNAVQFLNLQRLAVLLDRADLARIADRQVRAYGDLLARSPFSSERFLCGLDFYHRRPREVALVAGREDAARLALLRAAVWRSYVPNLVVAGLLTGDAEESRTTERIPLLRGKTPFRGSAAAYVCRNYACQSPTDDPDRLVQQLQP